MQRKKFGLKTKLYKTDHWIMHHELYKHQIIKVFEQNASLLKK